MTTIVKSDPYNTTVVLYNSDLGRGLFLRDHNF
jgi:hypothetical protein